MYNNNSNSNDNSDDDDDNSSNSDGDDGSGDDDEEEEVIGLVISIIRSIITSKLHAYNVVTCVYRLQKDAK